MANGLTKTDNLNRPKNSRWLNHDRQFKKAKKWEMAKPCQTFQKGQKMTNG